MKIGISLIGLMFLISIYWDAIILNLGFNVEVTSKETKSGEAQ